jgi:hypothetical protein
MVLLAEAAAFFLIASCNRTAWLGHRATLWGGLVSSSLVFAPRAPRRATCTSAATPPPAWSTPVDATDSLKLCTCGHQARQHDPDGECLAAGCSCGAMQAPEDSEPSEDVPSIPALARRLVLFVQRPRLSWEHLAVV